MTIAAARLRLRNAAVAFTPSSIAGLIGWWSASGTLWQDSARTVAVTADGDPIGSVDDMSGSGAHMLQATSTKRPLYKTGIINSLPSIRTDGVDDYLAATIASGAAKTLFVVGKKRSALSGASTDLASFATDGIIFGHSGVNAPKWNWWDGAFSTAIGGDATVMSTVASRFTSTSSAKFWDNGGVGATHSPGTGYSTSTTLVLAAQAGVFNQNLDADIGEAILYNSALSNTDMDRVGNYLATKYGLTWTAVS